MSDVNNTVDLYTAVNSGKRFRFLNSENYDDSDYDEPQWFVVCSNGDIVDEDVDLISFNKEDINSQFVLEKKEMVITESEFDVAIQKLKLHHHLSWDDISTHLKHHLGFK